MPGKVKYNELSEDEKKKFLGQFYSMVAMLKNREEVKSFLKDLLTLSEVVMVSRRIEIAKMLLEGFTPLEIKGKLKVGLSTIAHVERWLNQGFGGYKKIIERYNEKYASRKFDPEEMTPFSPAWVRKKYPAHGLLFNLVFGKKK